MGPSSRKRLLVRGAKLLILALVAWGIVHAVVQSRAEIARRELDLNQRGLDLHWQLDPAWMLLAAVCYLLALLPCGVYWFALLRRLGQGALVGETLRAYYIGHLGKYVPGKALVVVLRTALVKSQRVSIGAAAATVFFETLTMMAVGASLAAAIIAVQFRDQWHLAVIAVGLMLAAAIPTLPPIFKRVARLAGLGRDPQAAAALEVLGYRTLAWGWLVIGLGWFAMGLSLWAVLRGLGFETAGPATGLLLNTAAVALAMVGGFLSLIPGGAGVRELVLVNLLAPQLGELGTTKALIAAVVLRVVWLGGELVLSGLLHFGMRRQD